jgi:hypothetical protein
VMSSVGAVVLPCVLFYLFPLKFSRSAHRLATGREKSAPALTIPQVRAALAIIFRKACRCDTEARSARERRRWLERNELARLYHYKARKRLAPLRMRQDE